MKIVELIKSWDPQDPTLMQPYIIAEAGVNHEGSMDLARRLIDEAKEAGADAIKFQTYKAETIASKHSPAYWDITKESTQSQYELFKKYDKFWKNEFEALKKHCDAVEIEFMSTPFDVESAQFLSELMPVYKVASSDITNKPFIEHMCSFGKPLILSTGASDLEEIQAARSWIAPHGNPVALLHCTLNYPTDDENANLGMIADMRKQFPDVPIGYSDHTLPKGMKTLEIAALLGAAIIEKHFSHDKTLPGNDHYHAMDKEDLKVFRRNYATTLALLGSFKKGSLEAEGPARLHARRSLVASRDIPKGKTIEASDITWKRPAHGVSPSQYGEVLGRKVTRDIKADEPLKWEALS